jgi:hypothetical protein
MFFNPKLYLERIMSKSIQEQLALIMEQLPAPGNKKSREVINLQDFSVEHQAQTARDKGHDKSSPNYLNNVTKFEKKDPQVSTCIENPTLSDILHLLPNAKVEEIYKLIYEIERARLAAIKSEELNSRIFTVSICVTLLAGVISIGVLILRSF